MPEVRESYWRRVHREALRRAREHVIGAAITIFISVCGIVAAVWGLSVLGSEDAAKDEIVLRLALAGGSVFALTLLYLCWIVRIPPEWDTQAQQEIEALKTRLEPRIIFTWRPNDNKYFDRTEFNDGRMGHTIVGRVAVKNISQADSVYGLELSVINYKAEDALGIKTIDKNLINDATKEQQTTLHARREANYNIFNTLDNEASLRLGPFAGGDTVLLRPGRYYIKVTASAENMRREDALYLLDFDGVGTVKYRMLIPDEASGTDL